MKYPTFYHADGFAEKMGVSVSHVQHGARNFIKNGETASMAKLPAGWGAFKWGRQYIIYDLRDAFEMSLLFDMVVRDA